MKLPKIKLYQRLNWIKWIKSEDPKSYDKTTVLRFVNSVYMRSLFVSDIIVDKWEILYLYNAYVSTCNPGVLWMFCNPVSKEELTQRAE